MSRVHIVAGFPGVGKTTSFKSNQYLAFDSDSSKFDKAHFPENYIEHIRRLINEYSDDGKDQDVVVFCSTHEVVRKALDAAEIKYSLVYPSADCKSEYIGRYKERGSPEAFIKLLDEQFVTWVGECKDHTNDSKWELLPHQYVSDILPGLIKKNNGTI